MCKNIGRYPPSEGEMLHPLQHLRATESKLPKLVYVMQQFEQA